MVRYLTKQDVAEQIRDAIVGEAPSVDKFLRAGRQYDETGDWPDEILPDQYDRWRDMWMFHGRYVQVELEALR